MVANVGNWISQNCTTVGSTKLILSDSADTSLLKFDDVLPAGLVYYSIIDGDNRETGIGTFNGFSEITRDTVTSTKVGTGYFEDGVPLNLSGASIVSCTVNAAAFGQLLALSDDVGLRETAATGVVSGGVVTINTTTTVNIGSGEGEIVDGYTDRRNPTRTNITWSTIPGFSINMPANIGVQVIYMDATGTAQQKSDGLTPSERRTLVQIAFVYYKNGAITTVHQAGILSNEVGNTLYDWLHFTDIAARTSGLGIDDVAGKLSIWADSGELLSPGINIQGSITNPNVLTFASIGSNTVEAPFDVVFEDGSTFLSNQIVLPEFHESAPGVATALTGNDAVIHYVFRGLDNALIVQLGKPAYTNGKTARDSLEVNLAGFTQFNGSEVTLLSAQVYLSNNSTDFNDTNKAGIVSLIGAGANASGGVSVSSFLGLSDVTPATFAGQSNKIVRVDTAESAIEFADVTIDASGNTRRGDNVHSYFGNNDELDIFYNATISSLFSNVANFYLRANAADATVALQALNSAGVNRNCIICGTNGESDAAVFLAFGPAFEAQTAAGAFNILNKLQIGGVDVTVGAVDSGGAGFRVLRIPN